MIEFEKIFAYFDEQEGPINEKALQAIESSYKQKIPQKLREIYVKVGWGGGFCGPVDDSIDDDELPEYLVVYSPEEALKDNLLFDFSKNYIFGGDGGGEYTVLCVSGEVRLVDRVTMDLSEAVLVGQDLNEFFERSSKGRWFS